PAAGDGVGLDQVVEQRPAQAVVEGGGSLPAQELDERLGYLIVRGHARRVGSSDVATAFVTGGSGFIGGRLIERLRSDGHEVRALSRSDAAAEKIRLRGGEPVPGDLGDMEAMKSGASGCDWAFHAAAMLGDWGRPEEFERGNVVGTANALSAC